ncbi:MAG: signal recognition particle protein [Clostridiales bacterium]|nr:signal recognition particle protein [Clostridiales bacterium]
MAFEGLAEKLTGVFKKLSNKGMLRDSDVKEAMREVRLALLEADVNFKVARQFVNKVSEKAVGEDVLKSLSPGQQVIKIVHEELTEMMGGANAKLAVSSKPPTVIVLCGLQGAGKTTFAAKLALYLKKRSKKPLLAACDIYRPAAIDQLKTVGKAAGVQVFSLEGAKPVQIAQAAVKHAKDELLDTVIIDTAGRTHVDGDMMEEIQNVCAALNPTETLLVVDAMTGQEAVNIASSFDGSVDLTGIVLTKLDGDTRGGAALSMRAVTGKPIKFSSIGEKLEDLEIFHPDRMASRILGMGDVLTLIEKAQESFDMEQAKKLEEKLRKNEFTLVDFMDQMAQVRNMGGTEQLMGMIPGMKNMKIPQDAELDKKKMARMEAIVQSMTMQERLRPEIINASRKKRIAKGCGQQVSDVNRLLNQYESIRKMMRMMRGKGGKMGRRGGFKLPF